jgi:type I restriction enzyme R subunit
LSRSLELRINKQAIDDAYADLTGSLTDLDREGLTQAAARMAVLVKVPDRIDKICADIAHHYLDKVRPNGFKAMVVTFDQESCLLYRDRLISHLPSDSVDVVISVSGNDPRYTPYKRDRDTEEKLLNRFRDANDPLQILIVTAKLLTGFDAPILQPCISISRCAITPCCKPSRTNRTYGDKNPTV